MRDRQGNPLRTVWVLGAGFCRSLGGPLLPDLLRQDALTDLRARYPVAKFRDLADACWTAQTIYHWGHRREGLWTDAETFLDFVDCAAPNSPQASILLRLASSSEELDQAGNFVLRHNRPDRLENLVRIQGAVLKSIAAGCSGFVEEKDRRPERWTPYDNWAGSLSPERDTLITFNYDTAIEVLRFKAGVSVEPILPRSDTAITTAKVRLLKLHGSVDWWRERDQCRRASFQEVLEMGPGAFVLGTPGRNKRTVRTELLEPLWIAAETALRNAQAIVFIGYRFPGSDGDARRRLLSAIQANQSCHLHIATVLGPDLNAPDLVRLARMIEVCARRGRRVYIDSPAAPEIAMSVAPAGYIRESLQLYREPLLAEDYISLWAQDGPLSRPY